jgi:hypothetical protein
VLARFGSNVARTSDAPVTLFFPNTDVLSLKQWAAVMRTVGERSVPEHANTPLSRYATYGCPFPSG